MREAAPTHSAPRVPGHRQTPLLPLHAGRPGGFPLRPRRKAARLPGGASLGLPPIDRSLGGQAQKQNSTIKLPHPRGGCQSHRFTARLCTVHSFPSAVRHEAAYIEGEPEAEAVIRIGEVLSGEGFDAVQPHLQRVPVDKELSGLGIGEWTRPHGGYFISFDSLEGCAKAIVAKAKEAGLIMTGAGATFPYGKDPKDSNIRIAPSFPTVEELAQASEIFVLSVKLVSVEKLLGAK